VHAVLTPKVRGAVPVPRDAPFAIGRLKRTYRITRRFCGGDPLAGSSGALSAPGEPVRGYPIPREKNPAPADPDPGSVRCAPPSGRESHFRGRAGPEAGSGKVLPAVLGLIYANLHTDRTSTAPRGAITWPADTDKKGIEWSRVPVTEAARRALDAILRDRPESGRLRSSQAPETPPNRWIAI
jgi:hypothetical protein